MKKNSLIPLIFLAFILILNSCQKDELTNEFQEGLEQNTIEQENLLFEEGIMVLGEQLENPYSIENMQKAMENMESQLKSAIKVKTTHYYVRFRPKSEQELEILKRDSTIDIYDYPLDVEIKRGGTHYHDPSIPKNQITWQYTVVPVDYSFPKIQYQKLAKLFLPEESDENQQLKSASVNHFDWLRLETEALRITGNLKNSESDGLSLKSTSWRPSGTIRVWDDLIDSYSTTRRVFDHYEYYPCPGSDTDDPGIDVIDTEDNFDTEEFTDMEETGDCYRAIYRTETNSTNSHYIPLKGVEVRARRWFTTHKGYTDSNGNFTCDGTFKRDANYSIKWERWDFDIRDGSYGQAYYNGPKQTGDWNLDIDDSETPKSWLFAHIFRAAHTYYYNHSRWGIKAPPRRDGVFQLLQQRLHIAGKDKSGRSHFYDFNSFVQSAEVVVYRNNYDSREVFGTAVHELAHASHWELGYSTGQYVLDALFDDPFLPESWAVGVETVVTNDVYETDDYERKQGETIPMMSDGYTSIVWDMIDDNNQFGTNSNYPDDLVSGYTLSQLEGALPGSLGSWWRWRDKIKENYNNPTEEHLDALFRSFK